MPPPSFRRAAAYRFTLERALAELEADVAYTMMLAARAHARLSHRTTVDPDSLLVLARVRAEAGDASELEVELATVSAGEAANASASDSLTAIDALLRSAAHHGTPGRPAAHRTGGLPSTEPGALPETLGAGAPPGRRRR